MKVLGLFIVAASCLAASKLIGFGDGPALFGVIIGVGLYLLSIIESNG